MKFITVQAFPQKQWTDDNGKHHSETCLFTDITVKTRNEIGFAPMWAIPITTFKETLASMLLIAANYPNTLCVFETNDYKIVDKIQHYQNIKDDKHIIPITQKDLPTHLTEYVLDIKKLPETPSPMGIIDINKLTSNNPKEFMGLFNIYNQNDINFQFVEDTQWFLGKQFIKIPELSEESFNFIKREYPENYEARTYATFNWFYYKHLILPILLYALCEDTNPSIKDGNVILNAAASMSVMNNINKFIRLENDISIWSYNDCSQEKFEELYEKTKNAIIDDPIKLSILASGQKPERNKPCPCGSNKKYKKCHGKNN